MAFCTLQYDKRDAIAEVVLNRPAVLNAYNLAMRDELWEALTAARDDPEVRVLLVRGAGRAFCAGADLSEFGTAPSQAIAREVRWARDVWGLLRTLLKPVIAALHGHVLGVGLELALLCDLRIAGRGARFGLPEMRWGMIPAAGGTQSLPRHAGVGPALDLVLTGRTLDADEAHRRGLVQQVVDDAHLLAHARTLGDHLAALDSRVLALAKRAVDEGLDLPLQAGLRLESRLARRVPVPFSAGRGPIARGEQKL